MDTLTRSQLLADIATLYYKEKKTQAEIARIFGYSRSAVSRFLTESESEGIVDFVIKYPLVRDVLLESKLKQTFNLESAYVINPGQLDYDHNLGLVGRLAANHIQHFLRDNLTIGIGWGKSLFALVSALSFHSLKDTRVVQVIGAVGGKSDQRIDGPDIAALLASKLNSSHFFLPSPAFLESEQAAISLKKMPQLKETLNLAYQADITLLGIGTIEVDPYHSSIYRTGFLAKKDITQIKELGGVCNFCGLVLDSEGNILDIDVNKRCISADIQQIKNKGSKIIGIAAGEKKTKAIEAVLKGKWLDTIITDKNAISPIFFT
jgi:deoxyribonucleoside regulator